MQALDLTASCARNPVVPVVLPPRVRDAVEQTAAWLASDEATEQTRRDPYWPKWETPWWAMTVLWELGAARHIPRRAALELAGALDRACLHTFPLVEAELPAGIDPYRQIACHCALGTAGQLVLACGLDVDALLPWVRPWMTRYQLPDGGWNCDEAAYTRPRPVSSVESSVPAAELVLAAWGAAPDGRPIVDRAAAYLLARRLNRASRPPHGEIRPEWWTPCFPRLYHYDALRGLELLAAWAHQRGTTLPADAVAEAVVRLDAWFADPAARPRDASAGATTLRPGPDGAWRKGAAAGRPALLDVAADPDVAMPLLRARWARTLARLAVVAG